MSFFVNKLVNFQSTNIINQLSLSFRSFSLSQQNLTRFQKTISSHKRALANIKLNPQSLLPESSNFSNEKCLEIIKNINQQLKSETQSRIFAIVQLCGKQFKITEGDIILVEGYWPPTINDRISLDKVLLAGCNDFTLIGCPILKPGVCDVQATIIEKSLTHTKTHFRKKRRKQYLRINFYRSPTTMIRINSIHVNEIKDADLSTSDNKNVLSF